ncbi:DNA damage-regulated autophagy modulator protein 2-like [Oculina patagonica]
MNGTRVLKAVKNFHQRLPAMITVSRSVHLLPVLWPLWICITIFTPYIIAVSLNQVYPFLPSISKTAAFEPEGSIFGLMMTFVALFGLMLIFCRYVQLDAVQRTFEQGVTQTVMKLNKAALPFGVLCLLGVVVVANFRIPMLDDDTESDIRSVHNAGTALLLVSGALYYWLQTLITYHTVKVGLNSKCMFIFRLAVSCVLTFTGVGYDFLKRYSYTKFSGSDSFIRLANWGPEDGGYAVHVVDSAGEWIACLSLAIYAMSFYQEFQTLSIEVCYELIGSKDGNYTEIEPIINGGDE